MHLGGLLSAQELEVSPRATLTLLSKYANLKNLEMISCNTEGNLVQKSIWNWRGCGFCEERLRPAESNLLKSSEIIKYVRKMKR